MADDDDEAKAAEAHRARLQEIKDAEAAQLRAIDERFQEHKTQLDKDLAELGAADASEKAELKEKIKHLEEHRDQQIKDAEERAKHKENEHTMVVPPSDLSPQQVPPGQEHVTETTPPGSEHATAGGKRGWKKIW